MRNVQVRSGLRQKQIKAANDEGVYIEGRLKDNHARSRNAANLLGYQGESYQSIFGPIEMAGRRKKFGWMFATGPVRLAVPSYSGGCTTLVYAFTDVRSTGDCTFKVVYKSEELLRWSKTLDSTSYRIIAAEGPCTDPVSHNPAMSQSRSWSVILHGGCSNSCPDVETQREIQRNLVPVLDTAVAALKAGATAREVVIHAVAALEDCPLFNAGKGAALTIEGDHEVIYPWIVP
jgi:hypothetical protein